MKRKKGFRWLTSRRSTTVTRRYVHSSLDKQFGKSTDSFLIYKPYVYVKKVS